MVYNFLLIFFMKTKLLSQVFPAQLTLSVAIKKHGMLARFLLKPCIVSAWSATKTTRCEAAQYTESLPTHDVWEGFFVCIIQKKDVILW
jgi:hypothetical protein